MAAPTNPPPFEPEGPESEWKERLPRPNSVARTLAAFANGVGGRFWVGIRDDGQVVGVGPSDDEVIAELRRINADLIVPPVELQVERRRYLDRTLIEATVAPSVSRPVLAPGRDGVPTAFLRDDASTRRASRAIQKVWARESPKRTLDPKARRLLAELKGRARFDQAGPTLPELARLARLGQRAARRALVELQQAGLITDRGNGRYGLTPLGTRRVN